MAETNRIIDPQYDDRDLTAVNDLPPLPADWETRPPWAAAIGPYQLRSSVHDRMSSLVRGQIMCADSVVKDILTNEVDRGNWMAVPAMGMARQAVELAMKDVAVRAMDLGYNTGPTPRGKILDTHNLQTLGDAIACLLKSENQVDLAIKWKSIHRHLRWWEKHDPKNTWGRYGVTKDGHPMPHRGAVDVTGFLLLAKASFSFWYMFHAWLDAMEDLRDEYEADMRAMYADEY